MEELERQPPRGRHVDEEREDDRDRAHLEQRREVLGDRHGRVDRGGRLDRSERRELSTDRGEEVVEVPGADPRDERSADREEHVPDDGASGRRRGEDGREPLEGAPVDFGRTIGADEGRVEPAVDLQERVAADERPPRVEIGELELVRGDGVAHVAEREEPARGDPVEELVHDLAEDDPLGVARGHQAALGERVLDERAEATAQAPLDLTDRAVQESRELLAVLDGQAHRRQASDGSREVLADLQVALIGQLFLQLAPQQPAHDADAIDVALAVDAGVLQVVEEQRLGRPVAVVGLVEQLAQHLAPARLVLAPAPLRGLEAHDELGEVSARLADRRDRLGRGRDARGASEQDRGAHDVARASRVLGLAPQLVEVSDRLLGGGLGGRVRIGRAARASRLEQRLGSDLARERRGQLVVVSERREVRREQRPGEEAELEVDRGQLDVGVAEIVGRQEERLVAQDRARLAELGVADLLDPLLDPAESQLALGPARLERRVDARVEEEPPVLEEHLLARPLAQVLVARAHEESHVRRERRALDSQLLRRRDAQEDVARDEVGLLVRHLERKAHVAAVVTDHAPQDRAGGEDERRLSLDQERRELGRGQRRGFGHDASRSIRRRGRSEGRGGRRERGGGSRGVGSAGAARGA